MMINRICLITIISRLVMVVKEENLKEKDLGPVDKEVKQ
jgi:hypothetical protein